MFSAMVSGVDIAIGRIVDQLKQEGLYEDSIILFSSDVSLLIIQYYKGRSIYYVRREGGGGYPKANVVSEVARIKSYDSAQKANMGGRGSTIPKILRT